MYGGFNVVKVVVHKNTVSHQVPANTCHVMLGAISTVEWLFNEQTKSDYRYNIYCCKLWL